MQEEADERAVDIHPRLLHFDEIPGVYFLCYACDYCCRGFLLDVRYNQFSDNLTRYLRAVLLDFCRGDSGLIGAESVRIPGAGGVHG
jgi:hypothetical protein